ncbi:Regulatory protein TetR OS=Tsukamurella paurometabola (strain ATCC 8368 / DSM / CCUG 35730 /CIP 100753 / JCM 10117 / KCTC 9821 / NBRC 16120 / NCIMB 702349/ NCTC 13040) OX=521096 GN=Tpau_3462 PE=4 SV=1 [Tsukamurella paurometabola]|uniref:Regulatory protein TetR n=2 Tax=Tsukamurella paurometabola TaxID=2061 RepID=D5UX24_TSUPD|nr:regulatory protein TetR [Tsukamurella paurometabola DSM 20162]SUP38181.1 Tetracycline repressor protein class D [Tsukamurella paurometabola]
MVPMAGSVRRSEALTKDAIVTAAIEILDREGETGLTFRALATRLETGAGALYHHVAGKDELLAAAADRVIGAVLAEASDRDDPAAEIRGLALGLFDAVDEHPWVGASMYRDPAQNGALRVFEALGSRIVRLGLPDGARFDAATALLNYIVGAGVQNAANARASVGGPRREEHLGAMADRWDALDPAEFAFTRSVAARLREHDDREQFVAGVDLILAGVRAS